ncbi:MAG: tetratricopeptide repeat protein [Armatimonadota bacterium]
MKCQECGKDGSGNVCASCGGTIEESPKWYAEGIAHLTEQQQYAIACDLLEEGLKRYPDSAMLWFNGGVLEEVLGNRDGAVMRYRKVLELRPNRENARKALERLLGHPQAMPSTPPAPADVTPAVTPSATVIEKPPVVVTLPAEPEHIASAPEALESTPVAVAAPAPAPVEEPVAVAEATPAAEHPEVFSPLPSLDDAEDIPPVAKPVPPSLPATQELNSPWMLIRLISGIAALASFLLLLVSLIVLINGGLFITALTIFSITVIAFFASGALANLPQQGRRR